MQVMFKLNAQQQVAAKSIFDKVKAVYAGKEKTPEAFWAGNLLGEITENPTRNTSNNLFLTPSGEYVRFEGARHALRMDGGLAVLNEIACGDIRKLRYTQYDTSDQFLKWWETTVELIKDAGEVRLLNWLKHKKSLTTRESQFLAQRINSKKDLELSTKIELGTPRHRKMCAAGLEWKITLINHAHKLAGL
ncbi:hypothetical protein [Flavobacterium sp.]|uniref:hypothetical protein n=1 Tax=Flavobacterium sp. TaxID=239 RepID=UPI0037C049F8